MSTVTEEKHKCPPHHFIIDSENVEHCRYPDCPEIRDFGKLLQREGVFAVAGRRGAKARKEVLSKKSKQSDAMKELWQDPEYQAKMRAARKEKWQDPEYEAKMSGRKRRNLKYE